MRTSKQRPTSFYEALGKLFYAVAICDGTVHAYELNQLKMCLHTEWLPEDAIEGAGTNAALEIKRTIDRLHNQKEKVMVTTCYNDFFQFKKNHNALFTAPVKCLILKTTNAIASSFSGKNKSELIMLAKIELQLKKEE